MKKSPSRFKFFPKIVNPTILRERIFFIFELLGIAGILFVNLFLETECNLYIYIGISGIIATLLVVNVIINNHIMYIMETTDQLCLNLTQEQFPVNHKYHNEIEK